MRRLIVWSLFVLNSLDAATTYYCIRYLGMHEGNPVVAPLVRWNLEAFVVLKLLAGVGLLVAVLRFGKVGTRVLALLATIYLLTVCNNAVGIAVALHR